MTALQQIFSNEHYGYSHYMLVGFGKLPKIRKKGIYAGW